MQFVITNLVKSVIEPYGSKFLILLFVYYSTQLLIIFVASVELLIKSNGVT